MGSTVPDIERVSDGTEQSRVLVVASSSEIAAPRANSR